MPFSKLECFGKIPWGGGGGQGLGKFVNFNDGQEMVCRRGSRGNGRPRDGC